MRELICELFHLPATDADSVVAAVGPRIHHVAAWDTVGEVRVYEDTGLYSAQTNPAFLACLELEAGADAAEVLDALSEAPGADAVLGRSTRRYALIARDGTEPQPSAYRLIASMTPPPEKVDDYHAWYEKEHVPLLRAIDGWDRSSRYELLHGSAPQFMAMHDLRTLDALGCAEHKIAYDTDWRRRVTAYRTAYERVLYRLFPLGAAGPAAGSGGAGAHR